MQLVRLVLVLVLLLLTAGCAPPPGPNSHSVQPISVVLPDGRSVTCVVYVRGGVDCDWGNAK